MSINLISSPWLPVRRLSGARKWIAPAAITSRFDGDPVLALDFPRPDWNAAVTELLIGLLAVVAAPRSTDAWADRWATPFTLDELAKRLERIAFAFDLDGDGPRAFQDLDRLADAETKPVTSLFIEAAGENAADNNTDLFVKRVDAPAICPAYAAAALVAMQAYAPAGGRGYMTSMRGGGPLTTLALPRRRVGPNVITTLWDVVWAAVPPHDPGEPLPEDDAPSEAWGTVFPWLARTEANVRRDDAHPLQAFFAMPRRFRLEFESAGDGGCMLGGLSSSLLLRTVRHKTPGTRFLGWQHPLSPYRSDDDSGKIAFRPRPGGDTYRDWMRWVEAPVDTRSEPARCLALWKERLAVIRDYAKLDDGQSFRTADVWQSGVLACGFALEPGKAKALAWLEARVPFFDPPPNANAGQWGYDFRISAERLVAGTDKARDELRRQALIAVFGKWDAGKQSWRIDAPGKPFDDLLDRLWRETEPAFRAALAELRSAPADLDRRVRRSFLGVLRRTTLRLFDEAAGTDDLADMNARRIVEARGFLVSAFAETGQVARALNIVTEEARQKKKVRGKGRKRGAA